VYGSGKPALIGTQTGGGIGGPAVLQNNGNLSFGPPVALPNGSVAIGGVVAADLNGNGAVDLIATASQGNFVQLFLNQSQPPANLGLRFFPDQGGNSGMVTRSIFGTALPSGSAPKFACPG
jgi:hypothetical protein